MLGNCESLRFRESVIIKTPILTHLNYTMKKVLYLLVLLLLISCGSMSKIYTAGKVTAYDDITVIPFNYDYNFALIPVAINGKTYRFLVDTGAPTVISSAIYKDLGIKPVKKVIIRDSQGNMNPQEVVYVPEIKIGTLTYNKIGAVVADLNKIFEFNCMGIDGIIGANQMAKSYWKFDYENKELHIAQDLKNYDMTGYKDTLTFVTSSQKTPYVTGYVNGLKTTFNYDTGSAGYIDVSKTKADFKNAIGFTATGSSSIGLYGAKDSVSTRTIKVDSLRIGKIALSEQIVDLDYGSLIGNDFMNKHEVIMDWNAQKIYLKKQKDYKKAEKSSLGFGYRFIDNKAIVTQLINEMTIDLKLGDQLLAINDYNLRDLTSQESCSIYTTIKMKELETIDVVYLRDGKEFKTTIKRAVLIKG